uniref:Peptidase A1 domain-containing protein n=1 Tax=Compsopogon caeruleus TaxID=31354 RepID=A0A7S1TGY0_9RHOD|mmetsp:Transcript_7035/g.14542  ORF Transcript_7035/g.14542 Transcript_7035/m.14542 type:complete len:601 (+) Transcript_7035:91-1893(+)
MHGGEIFRWGRFCLLMVVIVGSGWDSVYQVRGGSLVLPLEWQTPRVMVANSTRGFPSRLQLYQRNSSPLWRLQMWLGRWVGRGSADLRHDVVLSELHGGITVVGEYYVTAKFGGQTIRVQIDTGSSTTAVPLKECTTCRTGDLRYSMVDSDSGVARRVPCDSDMCDAHTCTNTNCGKCSGKGQCCAVDSHRDCGFRLAYGDGSGARGAIHVDVVELTPGVGTECLFGGILYDSADFERSTVDGIMGLGYPRLGCVPTCITPIFDSYVEKKLVEKDMFTICIEETSGALILGPYDSSLGDSPVQWTEEATFSGNVRTYYDVDLGGGIEIGGERVDLPNFRHGIVDSGTTLIIMSENAFRTLVDYLKANHCEIPDLCIEPTWFSPASCVKISDHEMSLLPVFTFSVGSVKVDLGPYDYMIKYTSKGEEFRCVGIETDSAVGSVEVILGNVFMMSHVIVHDREQHRIGIQKRDRPCLSVGHKTGDSNASNPSSPEFCSMHSSCTACAGEPKHCSYNHVTHQCIERGNHSSFALYPYCVGSLCVCTIDAALGATPKGVVIVSGVLLLLLILIPLIRCCRRKRRNSYSLTSEYEEDEEWNNMIHS